MLEKNAQEMSQLRQYPNISKNSKIIVQKSEKLQRERE
jgi:hypothetical protein